ncbi:MAG TPA: 7-carboxy-7-deazaguanine synthase QueE, partial [Myxococcota bacterium]|nr:7-carboxy-7-deazaguanine synthase QueE [Myxococcota bacterium]
MQGEGPHVGESTLFLRLGECDLRCDWCDSAHTWRPAREFRIELTRGSARFRSRPNPVSLEEVLAAADALDARSHRFASLTGGEPLLQPEAVAFLARGLRARGPRILLETHGVAVEALGKVVETIDVVSMDWKLASDVRRESDPRTGPRADFHEIHERFLRMAQTAPEVVVKIVITPSSRDEEIDEACRRIALVSLETPVVLQPVTPALHVHERPTAERMLSLQARV